MFLCHLDLKKSFDIFTDVSEKIAGTIIKQKNKILGF